MFSQRFNGKNRQESNFCLYERDEKHKGIKMMTHHVPVELWNRFKLGRGEGKYMCFLQAATTSFYDNNVAALKFYYGNAGIYQGIFDLPVSPICPMKCFRGDCLRCCGFLTSFETISFSDYSFMTMNLAKLFLVGGLRL
jgi:hypothetical protein